MPLVYSIQLATHSLLNSVRSDVESFRMSHLVHGFSTAILIPRAMSSCRGTVSARSIAFSIECYRLLWGVHYWMVTGPVTNFRVKESFLEINQDHRCACTGTSVLTSHPSRTFSKVASHLKCTFDHGVHNWMNCLFDLGFRRIKFRNYTGWTFCHKVES